MKHEAFVRPKHLIYNSQTSLHFSIFCKTDYFTCDNWRYISHIYLLFCIYEWIM